MEFTARRLAHDLNNIAFVIAGHAQLLDELLDEGDPGKESVRAILSEIPRLTSTSEGVRALGRPHRRKRILIVEDEEGVRELLRHALERRGYEVEIGCTGDEGLALCDAIEPPDLLIADLMLPGAPGSVIAEHLRRRAPGVKVLLISGYAEHPLLDAVQAAGEPCLVKPFEMSGFVATVQKLLEDERAAA